MIIGTLPKILFGAAAVWLMLAMPRLTQSSELTYMPVNPNFGGSPLNGSFLLNEATVNNSQFLTNPANKQGTAHTSAQTSSQQQIIQELQQAAVNSVLSEVAAQISQGLRTQQSGTYTIGGEIISFQTAGSVINISITDAATGGVTKIQIPVPTF